MKSNDSYIRDKASKEREDKPMHMTQNSLYVCVCAVIMFAMHAYNLSLHVQLNI